MKFCRKMWMLLMLVAVSFAQDVSVIPNVARLTVVEKSFETIECILTSTSKTANLSWVKLAPEGKDYYQVDSVSKTTVNADGTFTLHRYLVFPSFAPDDAGTYKCSFRKPRSANEWQIQLILQKICDYGKYGIDCMSNCSQTCMTTGPGVDETPCHYINGTCRHGCQQGYMGTFCLSVCDSGKYGAGCSATCSPNCLDEGSPDKLLCYHVTGKCLHGCRKGYTGELCTDVLEASTSKTGTIVGAVVGSLCLLILPIIVFFIIRAWRKGGGLKSPPDKKDEDTMESLLENPSASGNEATMNETPRNDQGGFQLHPSQKGEDTMKSLLENPSAPGNEATMKETPRNGQKAPVAVAEDMDQGEMGKTRVKTTPQPDVPDIKRSTPSNTSGAKFGSSYTSPAANTSTNRQSPQAGPSHGLGSGNGNTCQKKPGAPDDPDTQWQSAGYPTSTNPTIPNDSGVKTTQPGNNPATSQSLSISSMNGATALNFDDATEQTPAVHSRSPSRVTPSHTPVSSTPTESSVNLRCDNVVAAYSASGGPACLDDSDLTGVEDITSRKSEYELKEMERKLRDKDSFIKELKARVTSLEREKQGFQERDNKLIESQAAHIETLKENDRAQKTTLEEQQKKIKHEKEKRAALVRQISERRADDINRLMEQINRLNERYKKIETMLTHEGSETMSDEYRAILQKHLQDMAASIEVIEHDMRRKERENEDLKRNYDKDSNRKAKSRSEASSKFDYMTEAAGSSSNIPRAGAGLDESNIDELQGASVIKLKKKN